MVSRWVMLCEVVHQVCRPWPLKEFELSLCFMVVQPVEPHAHGLGAFCLNFIIIYSHCCCVVGLDSGAWLWMPFFMEYLVEIDGFFCIQI